MNRLLHTESLEEARVGKPNSVTDITDVEAFN